MNIRRTEERFSLLMLNAIVSKGFCFEVGQQVVQYIVSFAGMLL